MAILTVGEFRAFVTTSLGDDSVQALLAAAEQDIVDTLGPADAVTELARGGHPALVLDHKPGTMTSVKEQTEGTAPVTLATDDYRVDGYILWRLQSGTNPSPCWLGLVEVKDTPADDAALRKRLQVALVQMDLGMAGGVASERVGDWAVSYATGSDYHKQRAAVLAPYKPAMVR